MSEHHSTTDKDSLMVLQALLNIRRDGVGSRMVIPASPVGSSADRLSVPNPLAVGSMNNAVPSSEELARHGFSLHDPIKHEHVSIKSDPEDTRRSKIQNALRSKPQRGRKRDDLSAEERMELTRTRNREHAKSTRVRKKARYQELLYQEQRFEDFKQAEALRLKRVESFQSYLVIREGMLRTRLGMWSNVQERSLTDVVADGFNLEGGSIHHLDTSLVEQLKAQNKENSDVCYNVTENMIAINQDGNGFAEVTLLTDGEPFITAFTKFHFHAESPKLASLCWCPIRTAPRDTLSSQNSYPSVVSLDPTVLNLAHGSESDDGHGHALDIFL